MASGCMLMRLAPALAKASIRLSTGLTIRCTSTGKVGKRLISAVQKAGPNVRLGT